MQFQRPVSLCHSYKHRKICSSCLVPSCILPGSLTSPLFLGSPLLLLLFLFPVLKAPGIPIIEIHSQEQAAHWSISFPLNKMELPTG